MKRCDRPALWYSWFNGFRMCQTCYTAKVDCTDPLVRSTHGTVGPCDVPTGRSPETTRAAHAMRGTLEGN